MTCSPWTDGRTDRRTEDTHESENRGHPFRGSGVFPSTYHQRSTQHGFLEMKSQLECISAQYNYAQKAATDYELDPWFGVVFFFLDIKSIFINNNWKPRLSLLSPVMLQTHAQCAHEQQLDIVKMFNDVWRAVWSHWVGKYGSRLTRDVSCRDTVTCV